MRIDAYNQIASIYSVSKSVRPAAAAKTEKTQRDVYQMSSKGRDYQVAKQAVLDAPDVRADKVADIRQRMGAGSYQVDSGDFADLLMSKLSA